MGTIGEGDFHRFPIATPFFSRDTTSPLQNLATSTSPSYLAVCEKQSIPSASIPISVTEKGGSRAPFESVA